ncbi:copper chaperone PCu(A)C [Brevundimonas variabilis]|uniref:Copper(I)-binding protein n=1 Tax=Brevundimonas variabilis TaxID=74312 RepID=A0A7W9CIY1_9CAUL|nr:copper chaperone PCu(A)C [Brevundimonas variabilis]MBB5746482.1 copper(I)-binding protein [Brevundimonas variabilis]
MKRLLILSAVLATAACSPPAETKADLAVVSVTGAICRPTPAGRQVTGCYLTLTASRDDTLMTAESPASALAQVHESSMENNMMVMYEAKAGLPLPAGQAVALAPGGNHIMLLGVKEPLVAGDTVKLTLTFASARPVEVEASVGQPALPAAKMDHGGH